MKTLSQIFWIRLSSSRYTRSREHFVDKKVFKEPIDKSFSVLIKQTNNRENDLEEAPDLENAVLYVKYDPETDIIEICDHEKARKEFNEIMQKALPFNSINR